MPTKALTPADDVPTSSPRSVFTDGATHCVVRHAEMRKSAASAAMLVRIAACVDRSAPAGLDRRLPLDARANLVFDAGDRAPVILRSLAEADCVLPLPNRSAAPADVTAHQAFEALRRFVGDAAAAQAIDVRRRPAGVTFAVPRN